MKISGNILLSLMNYFYYENGSEYFKQINICKVKNWDEVRVKGKFVKVEDINDNKMETYLSKWYYQFEISQKCFDKLYPKGIKD